MAATASARSGCFRQLLNSLITLKVFPEPDGDLRIRVEGIGGGHERRVGLGRRERREGIGFGFYDLVSVGFTIGVAKSSLGFTVGCAVFCGWIRFVLDGFPWVLQWVDDGNDGRYPVHGFDFFAMDCVGLVWFAINCVG
uniref:Uncharacterized protein n=1 Tax=Fagus sylvatica TaxID=28930 RepID=A0A2N9H2N8_FAGSY